MVSKICALLQFERKTWSLGHSFTWSLSHSVTQLSGVHGLKDFHCSDHLVESFGRSVLKSNFYHKATQQDQVTE